MTTNTTARDTVATRRRRIRFATGVVGSAAAAATFAALTVAAAATANADPNGDLVNPHRPFDKNVAITYSPANNVWGLANNDATRPQAVAHAFGDCQNRGGVNCKFAASIENGCVALAVNGDPISGNTYWYGWHGPTLADAERGALERTGGGYIAVSRCTSPLPF